MISATTPEDEAPHPAGVEPLWDESWYFDFAREDGSLGGYVRVGRYPNLGVFWYWACVCGPGRPLVTVVDHELAPPRGTSLEVRGPGLWADHHCEDPLERWSLGLEAFAVALDDPRDAYGAARGDRIPFGLDLEWETTGEVFRYPSGLDRYEVPCRVHGEVLVGTEAIGVDAVGQRDHSWGVRDWWSQGWCWTAFRTGDGAAWHAVVADGGGSVAYVQPPGAPLVLAAAHRGDLDGTDLLPRASSIEIAGQRFAVDPLAWAPVLLTSPEGRVAHLARALARFTPAGGAPDGVGWIELDRPER